MCVRYLNREPLRKLWQVIVQTKTPGSTAAWGELHARHGLTKAISASNPADLSAKLVKGDAGVSKAVSYQSVLGVPYAPMATHLDVAQAVGAVSNISAKSTQSNLTAVKQILR